MTIKYITVSNRILCEELRIIKKSRGSLPFSKHSSLFALFARDHNWYLF